MAPSRLLTRTDLSAFQPLAWGDQAIHASYPRLADLLRQKGPPLSLPLFAQPVPGAGMIAWYGEGYGDAQPLNSLPAATRSKAGTRLRRQLEPLGPLLDDAELGPLLRRALVMAGPESVLVLDDRVILAGWGLARPEIAADEAALARQVRHVLGPYLPALAVVDDSFLRGASITMAAPPTPRTRPHIVMPPPAPLPPLRAGADRKHAAWKVPLLSLAALVALLFLGLGVWLAWLHLQGEVSTAAVLVVTAHPKQGGERREPECKHPDLAPADCGIRIAKAAGDSVNRATVG